MTSSREFFTSASPARLRGEQARHPAVVLVHGAYADGSSWSEVIEIDSGHLSLITHPQEVTQLIINAVDAARRLT